MLFDIFLSYLLVGLHCKVTNYSGGWMYETPRESESSSGLAQKNVLSLRESVVGNI